MDRRRTGSPVYSRQWSGSSSTGSSSPAMSPAHPHSRVPSATGLSSIKRTQNVAAKAAAQRLAQVMASQTTDDDDEDDDLVFRNSGPAPAAAPPFSSKVNNSSIPAISTARPNRSPSPAVGTSWSIILQFAPHQLDGPQCLFAPLWWCHLAEHHLKLQLLYHHLNPPQAG